MDLEPLKIDRSGAKTRRRRRSPVWLPRLVIGGVVVVVLGAIWLFWKPLASQVDKVRLVEVSSLRVEKSHPAAVGAVRGMAANGYVVASRRAALSADTPGRIVELNVTEGSVVKKGDVVARLFSDEFAAAARRSEADLAAAQAGLARARAALESAKAEVARSEESAAAAEDAVQAAEADLELAQQEHARAKDLIAAKVVTTRELDQANSALRRAQATLRQAKALERAARQAISNASSRVAVAEADVKVSQAQAEVAKASRDQAQATLSKTEVVAPFDGVVVLKDAEVGEVVSVQGGSNTRGSVVTMVDFASLEVQADVPETSLGAVRMGGPAQIFLDAFPEQAYRGTVARIWPTANRSKATVEVRIRFEELDDRLRPEMGVRVVFAAGEAEEAPAEKQEAMLLVPEESVVRVDGKEGVFVLDRDVATFRELGMGERRGGKIEIKAGLEEGERIVADPPPSLESGSRVRLRER